MRHHNSNKKFGRTRSIRRALARSLVLNLIIRGRIRTTLAKARSLRSQAEKMLTLAKKGSLSARRLLSARLYQREREVGKLMKIAEKNASRKGGYVRVVKLPVRASDAAPMALVEFVEG